MGKDISVFLGLLCIGLWLITYVGIVWRGFQDKTFGMPVTALCANISWEFIYSFLYQPFTDYLHILSIAWFLFDIPIAWQCYYYGGKDFKNELIQKNFRFIFFFGLIVAFTLILNFFYEFNDFYGSYTGFSINFMFSVLFIAMLLRRDSIGGQSIYIAIFKWLGTFFAFFSTVFDTIGDLNKPVNLESLFAVIIEPQPYPFTTLVKCLYYFTFVFDIVYVVILYRKIKMEKIDLWSRF